MYAVTVRRVFEYRWDIKLLRTASQHQLYTQLFCYKRFQGPGSNVPICMSWLIRPWFFFL